MAKRDSSANFHFDTDAAERAVSFFAECLTHTTGEWRGKPFILSDWQAEIVRNIFGWKRADGTRKYRTVFLGLPRKMGKTTLAAGLALYALYCDNEPGAQVINAAADREQAALCFDSAKQMVDAEPELRDRSEVFRRSVIVPATGSSYKVLSSEAYSKHGLSVSYAGMDELHAWPDRELYDVLVTSMGARRQPLTVITTTAGFDKHSLCYELWDYAEKISAGIIKDDSFYPAIYAAGKEDDWKDPKNWYKACPSLGKTVQITYLEDEYNRCRELPSYEVTFKTLYLCIWANAESIWISDDDWMACADPSVSIEEFAGKECVLGCDLSAGDDLTAITAVFKRDDKTYIFPFFFIPDFSIAEMGKRNKADYIGWVSNGHLLTTQGKTTDHEQITNWIIEFGRKYQIKTVALDYLFEGRDFAKRLATENVHVTTARTNWKVISEPTKDFEKLIRNGKLVHTGNPCMRWNVINAVLWKDANGNVRPDKLKSRSKIDGVMATVLALYMKDLLSEDSFDCFFTLPKITV